MLEQDLDVVVEGDVSGNSDDVEAGFGFTDDDVEFVVDEDDEFDGNIDERCVRVWADAAFGGNPDGAARLVHADSGFGNRRLPRRTASRFVTGERAQPVGVDRDRIDDQPDVSLQVGPDQRKFVVLGAEHGATAVIAMHHCGLTTIRSVDQLPLGRVRHEVSLRPGLW